MIKANIKRKAKPVTDKLEAVAKIDYPTAWATEKAICRKSKTKITYKGKQT